MKPGVAFAVMLALAAAGAFMVLRLLPPSLPLPTEARVAGTILAGPAVTFALTHALAADTGVAVLPAWPEGTAWNDQAEFARHPDDAWRGKARTAVAVVTLRHAARGDPLFSAARREAPRVVEIDASVAADLATPAVRLRPGVSGAEFAVSPANAMSLAERIAAELAALFPAAGPAVAENLRATKERLLRLKATFDVSYAGLAVPEVAAATDAFDYLCEDFGVQIVARLAPDAAGWSAGERERQLTRLRQAGVRVSMHAAPPGPELAAVLKQAGVQPVVLDPLTRSANDPEAFFRALEANLTALHAALSRP